MEPALLNYSSLKPQHRTLTRYTIKDACVVDWDVLFRDSFDNLLCHQTACKSSDIVEFGAAGANAVLVNH